MENNTTEEETKTQNIIVFTINRIPSALFHDYVIKNENTYKDGLLTVIERDVVITGWYKGELKYGDIMMFGPNGAHHHVTLVMERRNHRGIFENPDDAINSFFKVKTKVKQTIAPK
jgi:hypothetical protein